MIDFFDAIQRWSSLMMPAQPKPAKKPKPVVPREVDLNPAKDLTPHVHVLEGEKITYARLHALDLIRVEEIAQKMWTSNLGQLLERVQELHDTAGKMLADLVKVHQDLLAREKDKSRSDAIKKQIEEIERVLTQGNSVFSKKDEN